ncbi:MAG: glycosyltransferase family 25 protein [Rhizomicrobium sp.]
MDRYFINLSRRTDRREAMETQARRMGLSLIRIEALDARTAGPSELAGWFEPKGPLGEIPKGDQCCSLSHRLAWAALLASGRDYAAMLDDEVELPDRAGFVRQDAGWIPKGIDVVKLEHYGPAGQSVLLSDFAEVGGGFRLGRMRSRHTGAAAYILSRRAARLLTQIRKFHLPVDHLLFNPNNSPIFAQLKPRQLLPTVARQNNRASSDIENWRRNLRKFDATYARRELIRFGYDLRLFPGQLALFLSGKARFVRVGAEF